MRRRRQSRAEHIAEAIAVTSSSTTECQQSYTKPPKVRVTFFALGTVYKRIASAEGGGGRINLLRVLSHLTIDHASLSRRNTVPILNRNPSNTLLSTYYVKTFCLSYPLPVSTFVATIYLLG